MSGELEPRIRDWVDQHGEALVPTAGSADTFGDGMRAAKRQVSGMLGAAVEVSAADARVLAACAALDADWLDRCKWSRDIRIHAFAEAVLARRGLP